MTESSLLYRRLKVIFLVKKQRMELKNECEQALTRQYTGLQRKTAKKLVKGNQKKNI